MISNTPNACRQVLHGTMDFNSTEGRNPGVSLDEDALKIAAHKTGLFRRSGQQQQRRRVRKLISAHFRDLHSSSFPWSAFPRIKWIDWKSCPWMWSVDCLMRQTGQQNRQRPTKGFASAVAKRKFCHIDTSKALAEPEWKSFFASLQR